MSNTKWTQGPWQRSLSRESGGSWIEHIDSDHVSHMVAFVYASHGMFDPPMATERDSANAHLIAAAPELYEALETLVKRAEKQGRSVAVYDRARAALAKARGEA